MPNMGLSVLHIHTHTNPNTHTFTRGRFRLETCHVSFAQPLGKGYQGLLFLLHSSRTVRRTVLTVPIPKGCGHLRARLSVTERGATSPPTLGHRRAEGECRQDNMFSYSTCYQEKTVFTLKSKPRPSTGAR